MSSSYCGEETVVFESRESASKSLLPLAYELEQPTESTCSSSDEEDEFSYFQDLSLKIRSNNRSDIISIVADNHATHQSFAAVNGNKSCLGFPSLPAIDEYCALNDFMPSLLKEKGLVHTMEAPLAIVSDNALSGMAPSSFSLATSSAMPSALPSKDPCDLAQKEQEADADVDEVVDHIVDHIVETSYSESQQDIARVGRSYSLDAVYSTPKPSKAKRSLARALSFQGSKSDRDQKDLKDSPISIKKSPQSVLDIFNPEEAVELWTSFHSL